MPTIMKIKHISFILLLLLIITIFKNWFLSGEISSGDAPFYYWENALQLKFFPYLWQSQGLGYFSSQLYSFFYMTFFVHLLTTIGISFNIIERLLWYFPFIIFSVVSSFLLIKAIFPKGKFLLLSPFIFLCNTYALMIIGGGQLSIALSYSLAPLVLALFIRALSNFNFKIAIICGLITAIQLSFEPRISVLTIGIALLYYLYNSGLIIKPYRIFLIVLSIILGIHFYWIFPTIMIYLSDNKVNLYLPSVAISDWLTFLSTASFSKTLSLLQPNWPENVFGKTNFMKPEFLLLPILAFSSLLFIDKKNNPQPATRNQKTIIFFVLLALLGAFLAKGINPPFGEVYKLLFEKVPGFNLFRDPTKFYLLVVLSYSILIPFSINQIYLLLHHKFYNKQLAISQLGNLLKFIPSFFLLLVTCYLLLLIKPAWTGELGGTFKTKIIPKDYIQVKNLIYNQKDFFRTLWIPAWQRYGYYDVNHPSISAYAYFNVSNPLKLVNILKEKGKEEELKNMSVKYVIIPPDPDGEYFSKDWKYDPKAKEIFENEIAKIPFLKNKRKIGGISIYEIDKPKSHFWVKENNKLSYKYLNPTKYVLEGDSKGQTKVIFSERYDPLWELKIENKIIKSEKYKYNLNSFTVNSNGGWQGTVEYSAQKYVNYGAVISIISFLFILSLLSYYYLKKK